MFNRVKSALMRNATLAKLAAIVAPSLFGCGASSVPLQCEPTADAETLAQRASPYDSLQFAVGEHEALICYSRPYTRGRTIFGELIPFDSLWRTGANEPTILHIPFRARIAGLEVRPGKYSLYTVPSPDQWQVVVNASTSQWGLTRDERGARGNLFQNAYTEAVQRQEVGRAPVESEPIDDVEQLTFRAEPAGPEATRLLLEWSTTRVIVPIEAIAGDDN